MGPNPPGPPPPGCLLVVHYWVATPTDDKTNWLLNVFIPSLFFVAVACGYSALQQFQLQQVTKVFTPPLLAPSSSCVLGQGTLLAKKIHLCW